MNLFTKLYHGVHPQWGSPAPSLKGQIKPKISFMKSVVKVYNLLPKKSFMVKINKSRKNLYKFQDNRHIVGH